MELGWIQDCNRKFWFLKGERNLRWWSMARELQDRWYLYFLKPTDKGMLQGQREKDIDYISQSQSHERKKWKQHIIACSTRFDNNVRKLHIDSIHFCSFTKEERILAFSKGNTFNNCNIDCPLFALTRISLTLQAASQALFPEYAA